ncbi:hypothetical protein EJ110_NYTH15029 [Nymphaea thermarum]|nr:hypothetical protein EJ110_NYTH15029 [Nymphaea thermarum]
MVTMGEKKMGWFVRLTAVVGLVVFCNFAAFQVPVCLAGRSGGFSGVVGRRGSSSTSLILPIRGSVYPEGLFYVTLWVGSPPRPYYLDVDTGSDFTWLQCDAPCVSCSQVSPMQRNISCQFGGTKPDVDTLNPSGRTRKSWLWVELELDLLHGAGHSARVQALVGCLDDAGWVYYGYYTCLEPSPAPHQAPHSSNTARPKDYACFSLWSERLSWKLNSNRFHGPHHPYKPKKVNLVSCNDPQCVALGSLRRFKCESPSQQCHYQIQYIDLSSSSGVLVRDALYLHAANGSMLQTSLAFGCGYDQQSPQPTPVSATDGLMGLGNGKSSISSQLKEQGLVRNVIGHCISGQGGVGYLFFGDELVPSTGVTWIAMHRNPAQKYSPGPANLIFGKQKIKDLMTVFDSGSSYTYFTSRPYQALVTAISKDLANKPIRETSEDITLPLCWQGPKAFTSFSEVEDYFKSFTLDFKSSRKARLEIPPENYLIITSQGNVCLGILNGTEVGLRDFNLIGDIFMQSYMIIYDNEKHQIGWTPATCNRLPRGSTEGAAVNMNILTNRGTPCSATYPPGTVDCS